LDGTVVQSAALNTGRLVPCISTAPAVTIGGVAGTVTYSGWVPDSIAGLYQVNVTLPGRTAGPFTTNTGASISTITTPVQLPVVVTSSSHASQTGVTMWVAPRLKVAPPTGIGLAGTVGLPWSGSSNLLIATEGSSPYRYAVTSGLLPSGLSLNAITGAISGTPAANTAGSYIVTVTATDSANVPVTGTATFTLTVAGGLVLSSSGGAPYNGIFGTANASLTTVVATGGTYPYAYAMTAPGTLPTGMTINAVTGVVGITALTPAGTYHVTVQASDSTSGTPLTGTLTFDIVVALQMSRTTPVTQTHGTPGTLSTVSTTGAIGTITYTLDAPSLALGFTINSSTGAVGSGIAVASTPTVIVTATDSATAPGAATAGVGTISIAVTVN
jgi:hypothetical protein